MRFKLIFILLAIASCSSTTPTSDNYDRVAGFANRQIRQEIPVYVTGFGGMIPKKIHAYAMIFGHNGPIPIDEARLYAVRIAQIAVDNFNEDLQVQEYLENRPFTIKNVTFAIFSNTERTFPAPEGYTDFVSFAFGRLSYDRYDMTTDKSIEIFSETYEEALQKCPSYQ